VNLRSILGLVIGCALPSCVSSADAEATDFSCPSDEEFPIVSQVLEQRCGTLDCHGDPSRPLRFYGRNGARLFAPDVVGEQGTSADERDANRLSVCGLEPEAMTSVVAGEAEVTTLSVVRKPLLDEAHKGGRVFLQTSPGYICFSSWIEGQVDTAACEAELAKP
jgi:hypothetical protein